MTTFASILAQIVVSYFQADGVPFSRSVLNFVPPAVVSIVPNPQPNQKAPARKAGAIRIGEIKIAGNTQTRDNVILGAIGLYPGHICLEADLRVAEKKLIKLGVFEGNLADKIHPTVSIIDPDGPGEFKDILVAVQEKNTASLKPMIAILPDVGPGLALVFEEVNFDITRLPCCLEDLQSGRCFRGANQKFYAGIVFGPTLRPQVLFSLHTPSSAR